MELLYGKLYRELYQRHWWWRAREEALVQFLRGKLQDKSKQNILDVGCGDGLFFDRLAGFGEVEGVEPDARLIEEGSPYARRIQITRFDKTYYSEKKYQLLIMLDVLEHLDDPAGALESAYRLLEPGGRFLLTVPAFQVLWTNHDVINHHRLRYRRKSLFPLLAGAGFKIAESQYWFQWTVPAKLVIGGIQRIWRREPQLPKIPPQWLNRFLFGLSRIEQKTLGATGIPFGSTLMVYCERP